MANVTDEVMHSISFHD